MPTPVSTARQCLTDEAARALDDAVAVARRRSHAQTTSLHAVSALLALPSATLRDACGRARSLSYSPRLQFRALELSVGVSLDRLPTTAKSAANSAANDGPPVSNSLMAAIKRSQANQRRHPESFHHIILQQQQNQNQNFQTTSFLKVELKHFILSILDDPIVSRVFAEAGFRSYDIKLALLQPPNRFLYPRMNRPVFLCNFEPGGPVGPGGPGLGLPFPGPDQNCRRILEILMRKEKRNPLLMGVYAKSALKGFMESVNKGRMGILPPELKGLRVVCVEKEIGEFVNGEMGEEKMGLKLKEIEILGGGGGIVVSFGEVEALVKREEEKAVNSVRFVVERLGRLLEEDGGARLVGVAVTSDAYSKFLGLFPTVDKDWDLHLLTVTSSMEGPYSKSSLMGSFVPFGGFFSTPPSEFKSTITCMNNSSLTRCDTCNEKYEQEVAEILKIGPATTSSASSSSPHSSSSSTTFPWLQKVHVDTDRGLDFSKANEDNTSLNAKIFGLQRKWSHICQQSHHKRSLPDFGIPQTRPQVASLDQRFRFGACFNESSNNKGLTLNEIQHSNQISSCIPKQLQTTKSFDAAISINTETEQVPKVSKTQQSDKPCTWISSSSSLTPVTTDLGLGTIYTSASHDEPGTPKLCDHKRHLQHLSDSLSTDFDAVNESNTRNQIAISPSPCSAPSLEGKLDSVDFKSLCKFLTEKVCWQDEAVYAISLAVSLCRSGAGKRGSSCVRADTWLSFLGPDILGKRKIASALAECLLGKQESLISVDLSSQDGFFPINSLVSQSSYLNDVLRRKTVVDYIAGELMKNPDSVIFLENVEKADFLVQYSLSQAIRTGRFPYSVGRQTGINKAIFILSSAVDNSRDCSFISEKGPKMFPEERILEAKRCEMQLLIGNASDDAERSGNTNVKVATLRKGTSKPALMNKRKLVQNSDSKEKATCKIPKPVSKLSSRSFLDLNVPLEEVEEGINYNDHESESEVEKSEAWLHDFCDQFDEKVIFKPFDFDFLAEQVIKSIDTQFQRTFGSETLLEIDYDVMAQILAAAWLSEKKNDVENWIEKVLGRSFEEAQKKYHPEAKFVMKLVKCESNFVEEHAPGMCLPARISLN